MLPIYVIFIVDYEGNIHLMRNHVCSSRNKRALAKQYSSNQNSLYGIAIESHYTVEENEGEEDQDDEEDEK